MGPSTTAVEQVNNIDRLLKQQSIYDANYDSDIDDYNDNCVATISIKSDTREVEPVNLDICIGNTTTKALVDSGSVCTIINKSLANAVVSTCKESYWVQSPEIHDLKTFSNVIIKISGVVNTSIKCNDWIATGVDVTVVEDGHRPIIGRDLFSKLGFSLTQLKQVANIDQNQCLVKKQIAFDFPVLITRIDADTVPVEDCLGENGWVTGDRSDILIEEAMQKAQVDARRRYNGDTNKLVS